MLIAITDLETTGLDFLIHEIIDVGLLVIDSDSLKIVDKLDVRVKPEHIETATKEAMAVNGYNEVDRKDAIPLQEVMVEFSKKTPNAVF